MILFNRLFYLILFLGFFLPSNSFYFFDIFGIRLQINEIAFIFLPLVNILCKSQKSVRLKDNKIKLLIILFVFTIILTEFLKIIAYDESLFNTIKSIRISIPLISVLIILYSGIKSNIIIVWKTLLWAISVSVLISLISLIIDLPIYGDLEFNERGRIFNSNSAFAVVGLFLLYKDKSKWYNKGKLPFVTSVLSILAVVISFSRSYLAMIFIGYVYLFFTTIKWKTFFKFLNIPILILLSIYVAYTSSNIIEQQINRRILSVLLQESTLSEITIENNREIIYDSVLDKISKNYWIIGLPLSIPVVTWYNKEGHYKLEMHVTDTSILTVLLRYGIIPLFLLILIYYRFYKKHKIPIFNFSLILYLLVSLNVDSLFRDNSVFFLFTTFLITQFQIQNKFSLDESI